MKNGNGCSPSHGEQKSLEAWPAGGLESVPNCPICGNSQRTGLYSGLTDRVFGVAPGEWTLYRCEQCQSAWLDPRPTQATIGMAYDQYYTHESTDHPIVRPKGGLRTFLHEAMNGYRNARYGLGYYPARRLGGWLIPLIPSVRAAVDAQCRHLAKPPAGGGRLLDVGFGNGGFLKVAAEMGWHAEGVDFDPKAVESARGRGLNVRCAGVDELEKETSRYDVITLCHVIEHVHDPVQLLHTLHRLLKPGGLLWIETPNLHSKGAKLFGPNWRDLDPPRHLVLFHSTSLQDLLKSAGFVDLQQHWRGLTVFEVFAASEAIAQCADPGKASRDGKPPLGEIVTELHEMLVPGIREFITFTARKKDV